MDSTKKVVQLNTVQRVDDDDSHLYACFPAPFNQMRERGEQSLQPLLQALFDNIDDALFELADRAESNAVQNMYFESMREVRIKRRGIELGFVREINQAFRRLAGAVSNAPEASVLELSVDDLSLVAHDDLDELVAFDAMVAKACRRFNKPLQELTTRLDTVVEACEVTTENNPFGPEVICRSFVEVCKELNIDVKAKLVLFKLFDRYVVEALDRVYNACNQALIDGGILPKLANRKTAGNQPATEQSAQQPMSEQTANNDVFADLQGLLHTLPPSAPTTANAGLVATGLAPQIPRENLMQLLQKVQQTQLQMMVQQQGQVLQQGLPQRLDIQSELSGLLQQKMPTQAMSIGQVDDDAINLVAMLFQFILDDRNLAAPMKALIARLQIPIIKVAMLDKSFFSKGGHPARKLLNEIATASLGWVTPAKIDRDPLFKKIDAIVNNLLSDNTSDSQLFQQELTDFVAFLEAERRRSSLIEQRTLDAEDGKAKSEVARQRVQQVLNEKVKGHTLPKVVINLLQDAWSNVLFLILLKEGEQADSWKQALQTVDDLLWSVQPIEQAADKKQLLKLLPGLLKNLRAGLTKIAYNPFDMNQLFEDLEKIHLTQLQETPAPASEPAAVKSPSPSVPVAESATLDGMLAKRGSVASSIEELDRALSSELGDFDDLLAGDDLLLDLEDAAPSVKPSSEPTLKQADITDTEQPAHEKPSSATKASQEQPVDVEPDAQPQTEPVIEALATEQVDEITIGGGLAAVEAVATEEPVIVDEASLQQVDKLAMGCWVEIILDGDTKTRCRLAAIIRGTGKYIFVNRSGMKVSEFNREPLALAIKQGKVFLLDDGLLFDRALESVIGNLRSMKGQAG